MKKMLVIAAICCAGGARGQSGVVSFENTWKKGSNVVYAGVENELILTGNVQEIKNIRCSSGSVSRKGDTLLIRSVTFGAIKIEIEKTDGIDSLLLNNELLPVPEITLTGVAGTLTDLQRDKLLEMPELHISARNSRRENIFEGFRLVQYEVGVGNNLFKQTEAVFSEELKAAIAALPEGKTFSVNNVCIQNPETGKKLTINLHKVFRLN